MKRIALVIAILAIAVSGYAKDQTITLVPDQDIELGESIVKYDVTTYEEIKDIGDIAFTVIDKVERLDIHQLDHDNAQDQKSIEQMTASITGLQCKITERNSMIEDMKKMTAVKDGDLIELK